MTSDRTSNRHIRSLLTAPTLHDSDLGRVSKVTKATFPILDRLSLKRVVLKKGAIREPHWHANAHELSYCAEGSLIVTVVDNKDKVSRFSIQAGGMFFAPSGSLHCFENVGEGDAVLIIAFSHEMPSDFSLHATFGAMRDAVLGNTYGLPDEALQGVKRDTSSPYLVAGRRPRRTASALPSPTSSS